MSIFTLRFSNKTACSRTQPGEQNTLHSHSNKNEEHWNTVDLEHLSFYRWYSDTVFWADTTCHAYMEFMADSWVYYPCKETDVTVLSVLVLVFCVWFLKLLCKRRWGGDGAYTSLEAIILEIGINLHGILKHSDMFLGPGTQFMNNMRIFSLVKSV